MCLPPDILEVLTDIDEMSRRRPEILSFFAVSISVSNCHWKAEIVLTSVVQPAQVLPFAFCVVVAAYQQIFQLGLQAVGNTSLPPSDCCILILPSSALTALYVRGRRSPLSSA